MTTRYRFLTAGDDYRPVSFPPPGPFWCSGYSSDDRAVIVAFLPTGACLTEWWPDAANVDAKEVPHFSFSDRFQRPKWWSPEASVWSQFRVWPDGTVQAVDDGEPHSWMSDDFLLAWAETEGDAR